MSDESALQEAQRLVHGERGVDYGHPLDNFTQTGRLWAAILNLPEVTAEQVALCMIAVKISRETNAPKRDNRVDAAGYAETLEMIHEERERRRPIVAMSFPDHADMSVDERPTLSHGRPFYFECNVPGCTLDGHHRVEMPSEPPLTGRAAQRLADLIDTDGTCNGDCESCRKARPCKECPHTVGQHVERAGLMWCEPCIQVDGPGCGPCW